MGQILRSSAQKQFSSYNAESEMKRKGVSVFGKYRSAIVKAPFLLWVIGRKIIPRYHQTCWKMCPKTSGGVGGSSTSTMDATFSGLWIGRGTRTYNLAITITWPVVPRFPFVEEAEKFHICNFPWIGIGTRRQTFGHCWWNVWYACCILHYSPILILPLFCVNYCCRSKF